eukprot:6482260-Amphidinium_carterae.1
MALLMQHIQGDIRSQLLLTEDLAKPNFEDAAKKVEDYYRNESTAKAKERKKNKGDYRDYNYTRKGKGYRNDYQNYLKGRSKGKYSSRPYNVNGKGKSYKGYASNYSRPKGSYSNYGRGRGKGKGSKGHHPTTTFHHYHHRTKERDQDKQKGKAREPTLCVTYVANQDTQVKVLVERTNVQH